MALLIPGGWTESSDTPVSSADDRGMLSLILPAPSYLREVLYYRGNATFISLDGTPGIDRKP
jgi:hypothetical protein